PMIATNWPAGTTKSRPFKISTRCVPVSMLLVRESASRMAIGATPIIMAVVRHFIFIAALALCAVSCSRGHEGAEDSRSTSAAPTTKAPTPNPASATPNPTPDDRKALVILGDSIAAGYGLPPGRSFPDVLQHRLTAEGYPWRVVNLGISGDTTEGGV